MTLNDIVNEAESGSYSSGIQDTLNGLLAKGGLIAQSDIDSLDERMRAEKEAAMASASVHSQTNLALYIAGAILFIGGLWLTIHILKSNAHV